jgi:16S rRNA processing protein RimM
VIIVGSVAGPRGLDGTIKIQTDLTAEELRGDSVRLFLGRMAGMEAVAVRPVAIEVVSRWRTGIAVRFEGISSRESAEALAGMLLLAEGLTPSPGSFLFGGLRGLAVRSIAGEDLGTVVDLVSTGGHDLLVVRREAGEWYLPMVGAMVKAIDPEGGHIVVDLPDGLLEVNP